MSVHRTKLCCAIDTPGLTKKVIDNSLGVNRTEEFGWPWHPAHRIHNIDKETNMGLILLIVVIMLLVGALPRWKHSNKWGYGPSGGLGLVLLIILILLLLGHLPHRF